MLSYRKIVKEHIMLRADTQVFTQVVLIFQDIDTLEDSFAT